MKDDRLPTQSFFQEEKQASQGSTLGIWVTAIRH